MNKKRWISAVASAAILIGAVTAWKMWNKPHVDFTELEPLVELTPEEAIASFQAGTSEWINQPIAVYGKMISISPTSGMIEGGVVCTWSDTIAVDECNEWMGKPARVHGRLVGFDELFGEVRLDQCQLH